MATTWTATELNNITTHVEAEDATLDSGARSLGNVGNYTGSAVDTSLSWDDATWILTSSFIIFTMQSGMFINFILKGSLVCTFNLFNM